MADDLKSRLDRLGERTPDRSDAFERLTQVRERKQRNRRRGGLAIGLAVALVGSLVAVSTLRDGGTPVPRGSDTPNVPAGWQPPEVLTIWPENSVQDATQGVSSAEDVQIAVDAGDPDLQWRLDPEQVAERFGLDLLGWSSADAHDLERGESRVTATLTPCPQAEACRPIGELQMVLVQPGRSDAGGVWGVSDVMSDDLAIELDPMDPAAALAERSAIDVELTLPENTVGNVGLAAANPCAQTASMAPQLAAGTTALFVPDMEQMDPSCGEIGVGYAFAYATDDGTRPATDPFVDADRIVYPWLTIVPIYVEMTPSAASATATASPTSAAETPSTIPSPAPNTLLVDCGSGAETQVVDVVHAQADGVHITVTSTTNNVEVAFEDVADGLRRLEGGGGSFVMPLEPGTNGIQCILPGAQQVADYKPFQVEDPSSYWADPALDCAEAGGASLDAGPMAVDELSGFASNILTEEFGRNVTIVPGGYPESADRRVFLAVMDSGQVAGSVTFSRGVGTEWFPDGYSTCNVEVVF